MSHHLTLTNTGGSLLPEGVGITGGWPIQIIPTQTLISVYGVTPVTVDVTIPEGGALVGDAARDHGDRCCCRKAPTVVAVVLLWEEEGVPPAGSARPLGDGAP